MTPIHILVIGSRQFGISVRQLFRRSDGVIIRRREEPSVELLLGKRLPRIVVIDGRNPSLQVNDAIDTFRRYGQKVWIVVVGMVSSPARLIRMKELPVRAGLKALLAAVRQERRV